MKKNSNLLFIIALSSFVLFSCKQKNVETTQQTFKKAYYLTDDTTKCALTIDFAIEFPTYFKDSTILDSIRGQVLSSLFGESYKHLSNDSALAAFTRKLETLYYENNKDLVQILDSNYASLSNEHRIESFALNNDKHIFSYGIDRYVFMGGAHGLGTLNYFNIDLTNGKTITEKDIFSVGYEKKLIELIKEQILTDANSNLGQGEKPYKNIGEIGYWDETIKPNANFYITDESINYVFNPYEIGPHSLGKTEVFLPYTKLSPILKTNSVIDYLVKQTK